MSIPTFHGNTFVAFLDICGLKAMMDTPDRAKSALNRFFKATVEEVEESKERPHVVHCIAVSDCAVVFVHPRDSGHRQTEPPERLIREIQMLESMLIFIKNIARKMIQNRIAIKGSISWGSLRYENRLEPPGMVKAMFLEMPISMHIWMLRRVRRNLGSDKSELSLKRK